VRFAAAAAAEYTLTATRVSGTACTSAADCAAEFRNQLLRGECNLTSGACEPIDGAGAVALGEPCATDVDCPAILFEAPPGGGPWQHFSCDSSSGKCVL